MAEKKCIRILFSSDQHSDLKDLTEKKQKLDQYQPFPDVLVHKLDKWFRIELAYNSNAIEGNTLNRSETKWAIEERITMGGKHLKEYLEARNHAEALDLIKRRVDEKNVFITLRDMRDIHSRILKDINNNDAGRYRTTMAYIPGSLFTLSNPLKIADSMEKFEQWLKESYNLHPVYRAAEAHYRFVSIHPFVDGNGRTARLLMNMILLMEGYPYTVIRIEDRVHYMRALEGAKLYGLQKDQNFLKLIIEAVDRSLDIYLDALTH